MNDDDDLRFHQEVTQWRQEEEEYHKDMSLKSVRDFGYDCRALGCDVVIDRLIDYLLSNDQMSNQWWELRDGNYVKISEAFRHDALMSALGNSFVRVRESRKGMK